MSRFAGTVEEIASGSWRAAGSLVVEKQPTFGTVCKPRVFDNEAAGSAFLEGWAMRHNASEVGIEVHRLGDVAAPKATT